jgi:hypothetical protein
MLNKRNACWQPWSEVMKLQVLRRAADSMPACLASRRSTSWPTLRFVRALDCRRKWRFARSVKRLSAFLATRGNVQSLSRTARFVPTNNSKVEGKTAADLSALRSTNYLRSDRNRKVRFRWSVVKTLLMLDRRNRLGSRLDVKGIRRLGVRNGGADRPLRASRLLCPR